VVAALACCGQPPVPGLPWPCSCSALGAHTASHVPHHNVLAHMSCCAPRSVSHARSLLRASLSHLGQLWPCPGHWPGSTCAESRACALLPHFCTHTVLRAINTHAPLCCIWELAQARLWWRVRWRHRHPRARGSRCRFSCARARTCSASGGLGGVGAQVRLAEGSCVERGGAQVHSQREAALKHEAVHGAFSRGWLG